MKEGKLVPSDLVVKLIKKVKNIHKNIGIFEKIIKGKILT